MTYKLVIRRFLLFFSLSVICMISLTMSSMNAFADASSSSDQSSSVISDEIKDKQTDIYGLFYEDGTFVIQKGQESNLGSPLSIICLDERLQKTDWGNSIFDELDKDISYVKKVVINAPIHINCPAGMFSGAKYMESIENLSNLSVANDSSMSSMFSGCTYLQSIDLSSFEKVNPTSVSNMFYECSSLKTLNISSFNTSEVTNLEYIFSGCSSLRSVDLSSFETKNVTSMDYMFYGCSSLQSLDLSSFNTKSVVSMKNMFSGCSSLQSLDISSFDTSKVTSAYAMFYGCSSLQTLDLSSFDTKNVISMNHMFYGCSSLQSLDLSSFNTKYVTSMGNMFRNCLSLRTINLSSFNTSITISMDGMFSGCSALQSLDLSFFETSKTTTMENMFSGCSSLQSLDISSFDTSKVTSIYGMFSGCSSLRFIDLSSFDTKNVTSMDSVFDGCSSLQSLDLTSFDTSSVVSMVNMFRSCSSLQSLDISSFDMSNVTSKSNMFYLNNSLIVMKVGPYAAFDSIYVSYAFYSFKKWKNLTGEIFDRNNIPVGVADTYTAVNENGNDWAIEPTMNSFIYDGNEHSVSQNGENCTIVGETSAIDTGAYTVIAQVNEGAVWPDGTTEDKTFTWSIFPAQARIDVQSDLNIKMDDPAVSIPIKYTGNEMPSCSVKDASVVDVRYIDNNLLIQPLKPGQTSVLLRIASNQNYVGTTKCMRVEVADPLIAIAMPSPISNLVYNGREQSGIPTSFEYSVTGEKAVNAGIYTAVVTPNEGYCWDDRKTDSKTISWSISKKASELNCANNVSIDLGTSLHRIAITHMGDGGITVNSSNPDVAIASYQNGTLYVSPISLGNTTITVNVSEGQNYLPATKRIVIDVVKEASTDSGSSNSGNNSQGSIVDNQMDISGANVQVASKVFSGKLLKPTGVRVSLGGKKLTSGKDFVATCSGGKKVNNYVVTVQGRGSYKGICKAIFQIVPRGVSINKAQKGKRKILISWKKPNSTNAAQITGYQIRYSLNKKFTSQTKTKKISGAKKTSYKLKNLKSGKKCYVQIRTYKKINGSTIYSSWSKTKTVKVK